MKAGSPDSGEFVGLPLVNTETQTDLKVQRIC